MANQSVTTTNGGSKPPTTVAKYLKDENIRKRTEELLGKRAGQFIASLTAMVNADNTLAQCEPTSLYMAAITAAALDLPINKNLAFAHIVPYKNNSAGVTEAQFQLGWRGYVQLAQRSGQYKTISSAPVYEGQLAAEDPLLGNTYDWTQKDGDNIIGYVAMFRLMNGFEKDFYMSVDDIRKHADRYSKAYNHGKGFGPWKDNFDAMALKTVLKLLISRWGPMSVDMQKAVEVDSAVIKADGEPEYIDGELNDVGASDDKRAAIIAANTEVDNGDGTITKDGKTPGSRVTVQKPADTDTPAEPIKERGIPGNPVDGPEQAALPVAPPAPPQKSVRERAAEFEAKGKAANAAKRAGAK